MSAMEKIPVDPVTAVLADLLAGALYGANRPISVGEHERQALWNEAHKHAVDSLAFSVFPRDILTENEAAEVKEEIKSRLAANMKIWQQHARLHSILKKNGIPYLILKGCACAVYYPDPLARSMGDVDFLVKPGDIGRARDALLAEGFEEKKDTRRHHINFVSQSVNFEMHFEPAGIPEGRAGDSVIELFADAVDSARETDTIFGRMSLPDKISHGLILLLHSAHHLVSEGIGLRQLCDWAVFVSSLSGDEREKLAAAAESAGLLRFADALTEAAGFVGCEAEPFSGEGSGLGAELLEDVLESGNLGQKKENRAHEMLLTGTEGSSRTALGRLLSSANRIVKNKWKAARYFPLLLPIGWAFFGLRYLFRSLAGKRAVIHPAQIVSNAEKRNALYEKLELFSAGR